MNPIEQEMCKVPLCTLKIYWRGRGLENLRNTGLCCYCIFYSSCYSDVAMYLNSPTSYKSYSKQCCGGAILNSASKALQVFLYAAADSSLPLELRTSTCPRKPTYKWNIQHTPARCPLNYLSSANQYSLIF